MYKAQVTDLNLDLHSTCSVYKGKIRNFLGSGHYPPTSILIDAFDVLSPKLNPDYAPSCNLNKKNGTDYTVY